MTRCRMALIIKSAWDDNSLRRARSPSLLHLLLLLLLQAPDVLLITSHLTSVLSLNRPREVLFANTLRLVATCSSVRLVPAVPKCTSASPLLLPAFCLPHQILAVRESRVATKAMGLESHIVVACS
jgi:hypothetical protein